MSTLLLRLAAPLQSWGHDATFERRGTGRTPTKSAVIGMVASSLGRRRNESIDDLQTLRFGVRVERAGVLLRDYHTAHDTKRKSAYVTQRFYLADATFLVGLESSNRELLGQIEYALRHPAFPLFLGRRSCPPAGKISLGIREGKAILEALQEEPQSACCLSGQSGEFLRIELDADENTAGAFLRRDLPFSFNQAHRRFGFRYVCDAKPYAVPRCSNQIVKDITTHNAMEELEG